MRRMNWIITLGAAMLAALASDGMGMAWITAAVGAGLGVLSSLYGGSKASSEARRGQRLLDKKETEERAWYARRYNQDYLDTAAGQNLLRKAQDYARQIVRRADGASRVTGATASATAKAKEQATAMLGNTVANIAAGDTARKDSVDNMHRNAMANITNQRIGLHNQKAANITNAASQASNALINAGALMSKGKGSGSFWDGLTKDENEEAE